MTCVITSVTEVKLGYRYLEHQAHDDYSHKINRDSKTLYGISLHDFYKTLGPIRELTALKVSSIEMPCVGCFCHLRDRRERSRTGKSSAKTGVNEQKLLYRSYK